MDSANNFGCNTISVGSLSELAGIITNFPPEQLQNVRLDSSLYEALSKSVESTPVQVHSQGIGELQQIFENQILTVEDDTPVQNAGNIIVNPAPLANRGILPSLHPVTNTIIDPHISNNVGLVTTLDGDFSVNTVASSLISPIKTSYQLIRQQQQQQPILTINENVLPANQTFVMQNVNIGQPNGLQGILPGEASSLILTPTLMSQVQPTATVQTINITDAQLMHNHGAPPDILSPNAVQTQNINLANHHQHHPTTTLTVDEHGQIIQLPIVSNTGMIPSTITIDPSLLKLNTAETMTHTHNFSDLGIGTATPLLQNIPLQQVVTTNNQCILVDGNIYSGNTILGQVITSGNLPVQQVLMSDINPNTTTALVLNGISPQQTFTQFASSLSTAVTSATLVNNLGNVTTKMVLPATSTTNTTRTVNIPLTPNKRQPVVITSSSTATRTNVAQTAKKAKTTIQTISNFSPQSSVFNQFKTPKSGTMSNSSGTKQTPGRNVIVKKTINVIKKSESTVVPMKPTSVEQVQPGVFKFQLKKVNTSEVESLLQNTTTPIISTAKYHITIPPSTTTTRKETNTHSKLATTTNKISSVAALPTTIKSTKPASLAALFKSINSPARTSLIHASTAPTSAAATVPQQQYAPKQQKQQQQQQKQKQQITVSNNSTSPKTTSTIIKSITVPKDVLSRLKGQAVGNVIKITDSSILNQLISLSKSPNKSNITTNITPSGTTTPTKTLGVSPNKSNAGGGVAIGVTISQKPAFTFSTTARSTARSNIPTITKSSMTPHSKMSTKLSTTPSNNSTKSSNTPSNFFTKSSSTLSNFSTKLASTPSNFSTKLSTVPDVTRRHTLLNASSILTSTDRGGSPEKIFIPAPRTKGSIMPTLIRKNNTTVSGTSTTTVSKSNAMKVTSKAQRYGSVDKELNMPLEHDLECKERGLSSPSCDKAFSSSPSNEDGKNSSSINERLISSNNPVLILEKIAKPKTPETSQDEDTSELSQEERSSQEESEEVHTFRQAIKSSHVGEQENQMRDLARQEIENQLKRFSQKEKKSPQEEVASTSKTSVVKKPLSTNHPPAKRKKTETTTSSSTAATANSTTTEGDSEQGRTVQRKNNTQVSKNVQQQQQKQQQVVMKKHFITNKTTKKKNRNKKTAILLLEESRKRERPKKYDDFILAPKEKKEKKNRKFFFPKGGDGVDSEVADDEELKAEKEDEEEEESDDKENEESSSFSEIQNENEDNNEQTVKDNSRNTQNSIASTSSSLQPSSKQSKKSDTPTTKKKGHGNNNSSKKQPSTNPKSIGRPNMEKKGRKRKQKSTVAFEPEVLPEHLKTKPKAKLDDAVIDLTKVKLKSAFAETSYNLDDTINSETYRLLNRKLWICTLCGKPGNLGSLDVLFGPYKIKVKRGSTSNSRSNTSDPTTTSAETRMNVWLHRDCAIWTSNVCLSNQTLCGLGESLDEAAVTKCCLCSKVGATLQCGFKQCRDGYHFVCAKQRGCSFQMENFTITCPKHR